MRLKLESRRPIHTLEWGFRYSYIAGGVGGGWEKAIAQKQLERIHESIGLKLDKLRVGKQRGGPGFRTTQRARLVSRTRREWPGHHRTTSARSIQTNIHPDRKHQQTPHPPTNAQAWLPRSYKIQYLFLICFTDFSLSSQI